MFYLKGQAPSYTFHFLPFYSAFSKLIYLHIHVSINIQFNSYIHDYRGLLEFICIIRRKQTKTLCLHFSQTVQWQEVNTKSQCYCFLKHLSYSRKNNIKHHPHPDQTMQLVVWNETCSTHISFNLGLFSFTVQVFVMAALLKEALLDSVMAGHSPAMPLECTASTESVTFLYLLKHWHYIVTLLIAWSHFGRDHLLHAHTLYAIMFLNLFFLLPTSSFLFLSLFLCPVCSGRVSVMTTICAHAVSDMDVANRFTL